MTVDQHRFEELMFKFPRAKDETLTDWFDRLMGEDREETKPRLPYRDPGEEG